MNKTERIVEKFFAERFPDKNIEFEKKCGYFGEWVTRFETGKPENYMDGDSLKAYIRILRDNKYCSKCGTSINTNMCSHCSTFESD